MAEKLKGASVTEIWFGVMPFGSQVDEKTAQAMVRRCLDAGITRFDTADVYNKGAAEEMLGRALKGVKGVTIASKVGSPFGDTPAETGLAPAWIRKSIDASLSRLGVESIDLYYMHRPDYATPIDESLAAFDGIIKAGKARRFGVSNYASWQVMEMISKGRTPAVAQQMLNLIARGVEQEYLPFARQYSIPTVVYNPLAGGLLTGKHDRSRPPTGGARFDGNAQYQDRYWKGRMFDAVERLGEVAKQAGKTPVELALQWVAGRVEGVLLGATRMEQLEHNLAALEGTLDEATLQACDQVWADLKGPIPNYNR